MAPQIRQPDADSAFTRATVTRRSLLVGAAGLAGAALLPGCSSSAPSGGKTTLRLQNWFSSTDMQFWQIGLQKAAAQLPDIEVKLEFVDYNDTTNKTISEAGARTLPDLIMASTDHTPTLSANGVLGSLDKFIADDPSVKVEDFAPGVAQGFHLDNHWWGFPYDVSTFATYYNKTLAAEHGVDAPPAQGTPWTWDELRSAAKELVDPGKKRWGLIWWGGQDSHPWDQYILSNFIFSAGGRNFDDEGRKCIVNSDAAVTALKFLVDLIHVDKVAPTDALTAGGAVDYFATGNAAIKLDGSFALGGLIKTSKIKFDVGHFPMAAQKKLVTGGSGFCMSSSTKNPDACWKWLRSFTSTETLTEMIGKTGRGIPARQSAASSFGQAYSQVSHSTVFPDELSETFNDRSVLAYNEYVDSWQRHLEPIFATGNGDIKSALDSIVQETNAALDDKWSKVGK